PTRTYEVSRALPCRPSTSRRASNESWPFMRPAFDSARRARPLLGTFVEISARGAPRADLDAAIDRAFEAVAEVHRLMSAHDSRSDVGRLNLEASSRAVRVHPWTYEVLRTACELHDATAGVFDIAFGS